MDVLRNVENLNPPYTKGRIFVPITAALPMMLSVIGMVLAAGAWEGSVVKNPVWIFCAGIFGLSALMVPIALIFNWGWRAQHFGVTTLFLGSIMLTGGVPWLCILFFSVLPLSFRILAFSLYIGMLVFWGWRFRSYYKSVYSDVTKRAMLYRVDEETVFYVQKVDKKLMGGKEASLHFPSIYLFIGAALTALLTLFYATEIRSAFGLPLVHVFLAVFSIPIDMMAMGFIFRGWLIYYHYPRRIFCQTKKNVYVDLVSRPSKAQ